MAYNPRRYREKKQEILVAQTGSLCYDSFIGGGGAGLTTAYLLDQAHTVTLFEKQPILGGNVRTLGKNVSSDGVPTGIYIDNGVIEFQQDHFVNFHKLLDALNVPTATIDGGSSSLFLANGNYFVSPGVVRHGHLSWLNRAKHFVKLLQLAPHYRRFRQQTDVPLSSLHDKPVSDFLQEGNIWHMWQKMFLMYGYSIPYRQIADFPAEIALPILRQSELGTRWTRVVGGVYSYMERIVSQLRGEVRVDAHIVAIHRSTDGVTITLKTGEVAQFDKVVFATPPDQVLQLLADPCPEEHERFGTWQANHATTLIHTDVSIYERYGVKTYTEFDLFQKEGDAGYNAYLNRLCGLPESAPHYNLAYNLTERLDPAKVIQTQQHHTPLYTAKSLSHRQAVRATNGDHHTYYAGAWMGNGLHEGAVNSALTIARLLGGKELN